MASNPGTIFTLKITIMKNLFIKFFQSETMDKINYVLLIISIIWLIIIIINL